MHEGEPDVLTVYTCARVPRAACLLVSLAGQQPKRRGGEGEGVFGSRLGRADPAEEEGHHPQRSRQNENEVGVYLNPRPNRRPAGKSDRGYRKYFRVGRI